MSRFLGNTSSAAAVPREARPQTTSQPKLCEGACSRTSALQDAPAKLLEAEEQGSFASKLASATFWARWAFGQAREDAHSTRSSSRQALGQKKEEMSP